jgi:anaphase-promoting complex subunit 4
MISIWLITYWLFVRSLVQATVAMAGATTKAPIGASSSPMIDSFSIIVDRTLPSELARGVAACSAWCPTMDLLAIVTCDDRLAVHRLNWQLIWSIAIESSAIVGVDDDDELAATGTSTRISSVTSICWRHDGRVIAIGQRDGTITLYSVDNGDRLQSSQHHRAAVTSLHWIVEAECIPSSHNNVIDLLSTGESSSIPGRDRTSRFFAPLPAVPKAPNGPPMGMPSPLPPTDMDASIVEPVRSPIFDAHQQSRLSILVSGDTDGYIHIDGYGTLPIAHFRLPLSSSSGNGNGIRRSVLSVHAASDLNSLTIAYIEGQLTTTPMGMLSSPTTVGVVTASPSTMATTSTLSCDTRLAIYDTHVLRARRHELRLLTSHTQHVHYLLVLHHYIHLIIKPFNSYLSLY